MRPNECAELQRRLRRWVPFEPLPDRLREHVRVCEACRLQWDKATMVHRLLLASARAEEPPAPDVTAHLVAVKRRLVEDAVSARWRQRRRDRCLKVLAGAALLVLVLLGVVWHRAHQERTVWNGEAPPRPQQQARRQQRRTMPVGSSVDPRREVATPPPSLPRNPAPSGRRQ